MRKFIFTIGLLALAFSLSAQTAETAERQFTDGDYTTARQSYEQLLKYNSKSTLYLYRYARCAQEMGDYAVAIDYFNKSGERYSLKHFFLGECYFHTQQMADAVAEYQTYMNINPDTDRRAYIEQQIALAEKMQRYLRHTASVTLLDSTDVAKKDVLSAYNISPEAGFLFRKDSTLFGYMNQLRARRIFASGNDSASVLLTQYSLIGGWTPVDTLPASVNMSSRQNSPYFLSDGVTLYYASDKADGLGGLDIYITRYNSATDTYTVPENIGLPFNSPANDFLYVLDETQGVGYWATDRYSSPDSVRVYKFESKEPILWSPED